MITHCSAVLRRCGVSRRVYQWFIVSLKLGSIIHAANHINRTIDSLNDTDRQLLSLTKPASSPTSELSLPFIVYGTETGGVRTRC